ncbi:MAG: DUF4143 domain-containing protein, partial [Deltaproteobacteria bacterium]|nr:DUF4143 domain-containing protein [Deltaproteobacteria bacterium]
FSEIYKAFSNSGEIPPLYFWRDRTGHEVDIVIDTGKKLIPVEIKSAETIDSSFFDWLKYYISLGDPVSNAGVLVHGGDLLYKRENFVIRPWFQCI